MLYHGFQAWTDMMTPFRAAAATALRAGEFMPFTRHRPIRRNVRAGLEVFANARTTHHRPEFDIDTVACDGGVVAVDEIAAMELPFGNLLHFSKQGSRPPQEKVLIVAPLSGHFSTLLRQTVEAMLPDHDVYITDWTNARDVPMAQGRFGFDDYIDYLIKFMAHLGPHAHVLAVCQPCVAALAAVAVMAEDGHHAQPATLTLMGGPIDTRIAPTVVNDLAAQKSLAWFERQLISAVPMRYKGRGRLVYPGFMQLTAFMSMNRERHIDQHKKMFRALASGDVQGAMDTQEFYAEYFAVLDLTAEFYLETVDRVFQRHLLPRGELEFRGALVRPDAIRRTALMTVEGERDDICAVGQTAAAHDLCTGLPAGMKRNYLQMGVGHYGLFSGKRWFGEIYPRVRQFIRDAK
jgi:poly(3-hydroxybutyrate) depolymerase